MLDLTLPIDPRMTTFPGDPPIAVDPVLRIDKGNPANVSRYCLGSHCGTHVDPPCHFVPGGLTVDQLPLATLIGPVLVVDLAHVRGAITADDLAAAGIPAGTRRLLLKTRNSALWVDPTHAFQPDYVHVGLDAAHWLVDNGVRLVGIDYLSIEAFHAAGHLIHHILLSNGVVIVEGLDLRFAAPRRYQLHCLPLKVKNGDGGPARVLLT